MEKGLLKFITCGSVDDGKSTLIGHMLYDAKLLFADQEQSLELESKVGSRGGELDYSLLLDGLLAEREQGITIDVAYRFFSTEKRSFIVADTPGHEEYTRNMAVGASFAELAVILVDASQGILVQTRRHARICKLMGIRHFVFAVNKLDLIHYDQFRYKKLYHELSGLAAELELFDYIIIPVSATEGDNVTNPSENMPWYNGPTLLSYLENVDVQSSELQGGFVLPIQRVCRPNQDFRGFQGQIERGEIKIGDEVVSLPGNEKAKVKGIFIGKDKTDAAFSGQPVTIQLDREMDISRGCVLAKDDMLITSNMLKATILWMDEAPLVAGRGFYFKLGTKLTPATILNIKYRLDVNSGNNVSCNKAYKNDIIVCDIALTEKCVFESFEKCRPIGSFILIDRLSNMTSACGVVEHALRRGDNLTWHNMDITREYRAEQMGQNPITIWFTGLSGAGKSTLANELEKRLCALGYHTMLLDGDNVRLGLNKNLGFQDNDRVENIRRVAEVSKLMNDAGLIVLTAFISPFHVDRKNAAQIIGQESFFEIYVSTPLEECENRDVKQLYAKARRGEISNFTGINSAYEIPKNPDITIDTTGRTIEQATDHILEKVKERLCRIKKQEKN